jgi:hypothetical protein
MTDQKPPVYPPTAAKPADKAAADKRSAPIDNPTHDPNHPANKTLSPAPRTGVESYPAPVSLQDTMTEQEKAAKAGGAASKDNIPGVGPATSTMEVVAAESIEQQGIGPRTPYPEGDPPPPHEETTRSQGIKTAKPAHNEPNKPLSPAAGTVKEHR